MYVGAGAFTGFCVGLTGVGGGVLMTPILLLFFGIKPTTAVGTDLWYAAITKIAALLAYNKHKQIDWDIVRKLWSGSIPAVLIVLFAIYIGALDKMGGILPQIIGGMILITAVGLLISDWLKRKAIRFRSSNLERFRALQSPLTVIAGGTLGTLVTLTSVGAGALGTVILLYLYPYRMTPYRLISTEVSHAIPLAIIGGLGYLWMGKVDFLLLGNLLLGSIPAAYFGAMSARKFKDGWLKIALAIVLFAASAKLLTF
jgi:uncharacterized protein